MCLSKILFALTSLSLVACSHSDAGRDARAPQSLTASSPPSLTYLGVAGWELTAGDHVLLFDPYFTRKHVRDDDAVIVPDAAAIAKYAPAHADAILVGHSHYDHALDVASIALRTNATVVGTESTKILALAGGVAPERAIIAHGGDVLEIGPFHIHALSALHSLTGQANEPILPGISLPLRVRDYKEGGTLQYIVNAGGKSILFMGTANFIEGELTGIHPDVAIIATGLREKIPDYACRLMRALGEPPLVLTNHFDDFGAPLHPGAIDLDAESRNDLAAFSTEIQACSPKTRVVVPKHLERFTL